MNSTGPAFVEVGEIPPEIFNAVQAIKNREAAIHQAIGRLEMQKLDMVTELKRLEKQSQGLLQSEAERLGIPEGTPWQLTPERKALAPAGVVPPQGA
jgi:hypothetical protein